MTSKHKAVAYVLIMMFVVFGEVLISHGKNDYAPLSMISVGVVGWVAVYWLGQEKVVDISL